jgi:acyl carrier protein
MTNEQILSELTEMISDLLDLEGLNLDTDTVANDVDGWDSLAHVRIVVGIEQHFSIRFSTSEITSLNTVGDLVSLIQKHQSPAE